MSKRSYTKRDVVERFWEKVDFGDCWLWTGQLIHNGYGKFFANGSYRSAHRFSYELLMGPIPDGYELDHLCRVRHCVNPDHLEPVSHRENVLRGVAVLRAAMAKRAQTHCKRGHEFDEANTRLYDGRRYCRACRVEYQAQARHSNGVRG